MSVVTSKIEPLLRLLSSWEEGMALGDTLDLGVVNEVKETVNAIISIALNDINKRKHVRMCTALLFDESQVSWGGFLRRYAGCSM